MENITNETVNTMDVVDEFDLLIANEKLNEEMAVEHTPSEDTLHNYICDVMSSDSKLVEGVLKNDRTIKGSMDYCGSKAYESAKSGNVAMVDSDTVFGWAVEYFKLEKVETASIPYTTHTSVQSEQSKRKEKEKELFGISDSPIQSSSPKPKISPDTVVPGQLDMFEDLFGGEE